MEKLYASKTFLKMAGGRMHTPYPGSAPGHKLQKPSIESGMFQSLGTISFVLFYQKTESKRGRQYPPQTRFWLQGMLENIAAVRTHKLHA